jgi:hypothetical protein
LKGDYWRPLVESDYWKAIIGRHFDMGSRMLRCDWKKYYRKEELPVIKGGKLRIRWTWAF